MLEGVLDVSWTCDQASVLGAGNDKSIRVWDPTTGRVRHTMTGHTGKVGANRGLLRSMAEPRGSDSMTCQLLLCYSIVCVVYASP